MAKGMLPLSKLCAMVTMQRQHPNEAQMFSLPLIPRTDSPTGHQPQPSGTQTNCYFCINCTDTFSILNVVTDLLYFLGLLDVCIRYKHRPVRPEGQAGKGAASRLVTLVVQVHRASGLQAAARYITISVSFGT